ncbi:ABC transporter permease [Candidatus Formimonas warabiya]|uniref:ABC transporter permease n=1 Tax=Formimonas warabiya TaxID=1761012 RepID=A0A3G1L0N0_FORW1|nr:ABC transporter permease [Candidatus Formimonas warabiya]ATW28220.1 ABC transporter permease [Candidatus Formimonas warabiya]
MYVTIFLGTIEQGLLWSIMVLGLYMTFRVLDYADLTVDGSFALGAAVAARLIFGGHDPWTATLLAIVAGAVAGMITGILHTQFRIAPLLSGILSMIALYSINLRIMGKANISLLRLDTVMSKITAIGVPEQWAVLVIGVLVAVLAVVILWLFLNTEMGFAMRATGDNAQMIRSLGVNTNRIKIIGLSLSNALVALSGALVAQYQSFADVGMGIGTIVVGLASVIIGEVLFGTKSIMRTLIAVVLGSLVYRIVVAVVLQLGLNPTDLRLFTALIVTVALASPILKGKVQSWVASGKGEKSA